MKIIYILFICIGINYCYASSGIPDIEIPKTGFLSKEWIAKEMKCFKFCSEREYDAYDYKFGSNKSPACICKNVKLKQQICRDLSNDEYLEKFERYKKNYINTKVEPLLKRYYKHFPKTVEKINTKHISLTPSKNNKPNIKLMIKI